MWLMLGVRGQAVVSGEMNLRVPENSRNYLIGRGDGDF
jgi:hypothetical protein